MVVQLEFKQNKVLCEKNWVMCIYSIELIAAEVEQKNKQAFAVVRISLKLIQNVMLRSCFLDKLWHLIIAFIWFLTGSHSPWHGSLVMLPNFKHYFDFIGLF